MKQLKRFKSSVSLTLTLTEPERVGSLEIPGVSVSSVSKELKASVEQQKDKEASGSRKNPGHRRGGVFSIICRYKYPNIHFCSSE